MAKLPVQQFRSRRGLNIVAETAGHATLSKVEIQSAVGSADSVFCTRRELSGVSQIQDLVYFVFFTCFRCIFHVCQCCFAAGFECIYEGPVRCLLLTYKNVEI